MIDEKSAGSHVCYYKQPDGDNVYASANAAKRAGSPSRAARKLQATTPSGSLKRAAKGLAEAGRAYAHAARAPKQLS